jgi:hypothetical protein
MAAGRLLAAAGLLVICGCSASGDDPAYVPSSGPDSGKVPADPGTLKLNEFMLASSGEDNEQPWIEIVNQSDASVSLAPYRLTIGGEDWLLPNELVAAGDFVVLRDLRRADGTADSFLSGDVRDASLRASVDGAIVDYAQLPALDAGESGGRFPDGNGNFVVYHGNESSPGLANRDVGFTLERTSHAEFRPRDSSPNAILRHDGHYWILGGWSNFGIDLWSSYTDVWRSSDGVRWELVNAAPPHDHYCSYATWRGRMWALGSPSYSTGDGVTWRPEPGLDVNERTRSVVLADNLVNVDGAVVRQSSDGQSWTILTDSAPWGPERQQPMLLVHRGKLWLMGGVSGYGTPGQSLHRDVWTSSDGRTWERVSETSPWAPRQWSSAVAYDDKIFLLNGANQGLWPEEFGNVSEIWLTDDGRRWMRLASESAWPARHASLVVQGRDDNLLLLAGYGHGGIARMHNDSWELRASVYFPKPTGDLHRLRTWGSNLDGSGTAPTSFAHDYQLFVLTNRPRFVADARWRVSGRGSRVLVGTDSGDRVVLELRRGAAANLPLYLRADSTTIAADEVVDVRFREPGAVLVLP